MTRPFSALLFAAFLVLCVGRRAGADVVNCNDPAYSSACAGIVNFSVAGGANPYVYVSNPQGNYLDLTNPAQISFSQTAGNPEQAAGSLASGILTATDQAISVYDDYDSLGINANDIFTLSGAAGLVSITAQFKVSGTAYLQAVGPGESILIDGGDAHIVLCGPGGSFACGGDAFQDTGGPPFAGGTFAVTSEYTGQPYLEVDYTWMQQVGTPFGVYYGMSMDVYSGSEIDLTDPGTLSFNLPAGYTISSEGGFTGGAPAGAVPEPGSIFLLAPVLVLSGLLHRRLLGDGLK